MTSPTQSLRRTVLTGGPFPIQSSLDGLGPISAASASFSSSSLERLVPTEDSTLLMQEYPSHPRMEGALHRNWPPNDQPF